MTAPARMTAEREAELRHEHRLQDVQPRFHIGWCFGCDESVAEGGRCQVVELLDALDAERAHAQQVEVPHSSAAVLGYSVASAATEWSSGWVLTGHSTLTGDDVQLDLDPMALASEEVIEGRSVLVAVVRVGTDGQPTP